MKAKSGKGRVPGASRPVFQWTFRWAGPGVRRALLGVLGGVVLGPAALTGVAHAQQPAARATAQPMPPKTPMNKSTAVLPIQIDPRLRATLREVQLFVKDDPARPWVRQETAAPDQKEFVFRAPRDGEYWFTVVTVDKAGRFNPADLRNVTPGVIVLVDTQAPEPDVRCLPETPEGRPVQCVSRDANPDPSRTRFEYQTGDQKWRPVDAAPHQPDVFCIPQQAVVTGMVRVTMADRCGNSVTREVNLSTCGGTVNTPVTADSGPDKAATARNAVQPAHQDSPVVVPQPSPPTSREMAAYTALKTAPPGAMPAVSAVPIGAVTTAAEADAAVTRTSWSGQEGGAIKTAAGTMARKVVNGTRVYLEYKIEQAGPSGVGRIDVFVTKNQGQSWEHVGEDEDRQSPVVVELPGEGLFGVKLVVSNGRGFGGAPPSAGDTPDWWVEVDTTKPFAELTSVQSGQASDPGAVLITWTARDNNLSADPVDLFYAINQDGPWQPIARGLKNESPYHWSVPRDVGGHAYIRLKVTDQGGNFAQCETSQPVLLDDGTRPRIRVTGVSTNGPSVPSSSAPSLPSFP